MLGGNVAGGSACLLAYELTRLVKTDDGQVLVVYPSIFLVPFTIGVVAAWI
jgi:hypothetical protein